MIGRALSHYQIIEKLGEGGMGVVYKARDTHLDRFVAIKVLPAEKVADPDRKRRFVQEARAASALNHPNIITIYDIDQADGVDFIAMEHVAGKTLDESIPRKGLRLSVALKYAVQIADALARAHGAGIIHRDVKPSNVMVDEHGLVKVLDFGLAKLTGQAGSEDEATATVGVKTEEGTVVGSAPYLSPEQAEGRRLDARSDIFSFGAVLYEMLSGRRAFAGDSKMATMAAVIREEPAPLADDVPAELVRLVNRCLRKDPAWRFQHMDDLRVALAELEQESSSGKLAGAAPGGGRHRWRWWWLAGGVAAVAVLAAGGWLLHLRSTPRATGPRRSVGPVTAYPGFERQPVFSPDGNDIAFTWDGPGRDNFDVYRKQIGAGEPLRLTSDAAPDISPAWSPDGRQIAFLRVPPGGKAQLRLVPALGGSERMLAEVPAPSIYISPLGTWLTWTPDGRWLVTPDLQLVSVETGEAHALTALAGAGGWDISPAFSPDGATLAFCRRLGNGMGDLYLLPLAAGYRAAGEPKRLTYEDSEVCCPAWSPEGKEIYFSAGKRFSERRVLRVNAAPPAAQASYRAEVTPFGDGAWTMAMSGDGRRLAFTREVWDANVYRVRLPGPATPERLIASTALDYNAEYSPDGREIAFVSTRSGTQEIWIANAEGAGPRQLTAAKGPQTSNPRWSPDGKTILFDSFREGKGDLYVVNAAGGAPRRITQDPQHGGEARWSRDGRWIYCPFPKDGRLQLFRIPAGGGTPVQLTRDGGGPAAESPDGKWIYYGRGGILRRIPTGGGESSRVLEGLSYGYNFVAVEDGVYFTAGERQRLGSEPLRVEFYELATGKRKLIAETGKPGTLGLSISPDKRWLLVSQFDEAGADIMLVENFR